MSFILILSSVILLVNCSPKTAKKTTASKEVERTSKAQIEAVPAARLETVVVDDPAEITPVKKDKKENNLASLGADEKLTIFQNMVELRVEIGQKLYSKNCGKCHELYAVNSRNAETWVSVLDQMAPKAELNTDQHMMVGGYLVQNAKK